MTEFIIGTVGFPIARDRMKDSVDIVEITDARHIPPSAKAARHQRAGAWEDLKYAVQISRFFVESPSSDVSLKGSLGAYGDFQITEETTGLWKRQVEFAAALDAMALVLITPPSVTPSALNVDRMSAFFQKMDPGPLRIVWEPHGPWDHARASAFAAAHGLILAFDPLRDEPEGGEFGYFRFGPFSSMGSRFGVYDLERIIDLGSAYETVCCVFDTRRALDDAKNLKKILEEGIPGGDEF